MIRIFSLLFLLLILPSAAMGMGERYKKIFEKEFLTKPWAGGPIVEKSMCIECHTSDIMKPAFRAIMDEWQGSWHALNEVSCHDCHGGDPKDPSLSMSHVRGFVGKPKYDAVPGYCGKCHIGIMKTYLESGHGKTLKAAKKGPNCITCHGSHGIQRATIDIINEQSCSRCHSYERAKGMKQALFLTEKKIDEIRSSLKALKNEGIYTAEDEKAFFSTEAEFRTLFHTIDVNLVNDRTDEFLKKLDVIEKNVQATFNELDFRKNFSAFLMLVFAVMGVVIFLISRSEKD